jgi:hypothetical protein
MATSLASSSAAAAAAAASALSLYRMASVLMASSFGGMFFVGVTATGCRSSQKNRQ